MHRPSACSPANGGMRPPDCGEGENKGKGEGEGAWARQLMPLLEARRSEGASLARMQPEKQARRAHLTQALYPPSLCASGTINASELGASLHCTPRMNPRVLASLEPPE